MRLLKRNTVVFEYLANTGQEEVLKNGLHTGNFDAVYDAPVPYRGHISAPNGYATDNMFGVNTQYTHVLLMDKPKADIREDGLIVWDGNEYDIQAVRGTLNVLAVALKKRTKNHAVRTKPGTVPEATGTTGGEGS